MSKLFTLLLLTAVFGAFAPQQVQAAADSLDPPKEIYAIRTNSPRIDGVLEAEWLRGAVAEGFIQREPDNGEPASMPTRVYVLYNDDALYFGFLCLDTAPDSIMGRVQRRDNDARSDYVDIYLDTYHDRRNGYWFTVTAAGVQAEGTMFNETNLTASWDAVWQSAVGRTDSSWVAEVRVPFQTIRHAGPREDGWGLNFARKIERRTEAAFWQPVDRRRGFRVGEMGYLKGLRDIASATHLEILPHVVGRWDANSKDPAQGEQGEWQSGNEWENLGLHVKAVPSASLTMDLAYQPDFAQVDIDEEFINLDPYPVFLEEKRPFFLEAKELFDNAPIQLLYTRRITDPDYGGKLNALMGKVRTSTVYAKNRTEDDRLQDAAATRVEMNVGRLHTAGVTASHLNDPDLDFQSTAGEADTRIRWGRENALKLSAAVVDRTGPSDEPFQVQAQVFEAWNQYFKSDYRFLYRGQDFNINDLGWSTYSNVMQHAFYFYGNHYPKAGPIQRIGWDVPAFQNSLIDGSFPQGDIEISPFFQTRNNNWFGGSVSNGIYSNRVYNDEGEFSDNFGVFDINRHPGGGWSMWFESDSRRPWEVDLNFGRYKFREGQRWNSGFDLLVKPRSNLETSIAFDWTQVWKVGSINDYGVTDFRIWGWSLRYSPSLRSSFRGTLQLVHDNNGGDNYQFLTNLLWAWNWHPGSWFYLVYDESHSSSQPYAEPLFGDRTVRLKWTYFLTVP